jgi:restriction endonuclease Mrr
MRYPQSLTDDQSAILTEMADRQAYKDRDGNVATAQQIAEGCDHWFETEWASSRLPGLIKRGLVERVSRGCYRITEAGRAAINAGGR